MRVGLVCPYSLISPGGVQNHVLGLARHLAEAGYRPHVLAPGPIGAATVHGLDARQITSAGSAIPLRYNGSIARVNFGPLTAQRVRRWLHRTDIDVLHIHEPVTPSISWLALRTAAVDHPVVATFHTATPRSRSLQLAATLGSAMIDRIDARIAVSESAREVVRTHLGRDATVIPNGIRLADFVVREPVDRVPRRVVFLGRGNEPRKGLDVLLAAVPRIRAAWPDVEVVLAGWAGGSLPDGCRAVGPVSNDDRSDLLASAEVFVAPHRDRESFGIVLLEAMASGAGLVASDIRAFRDLLRAEGPEPLGTLFPAGDPAGLARAVIDALDRPRPQRVRAARAVAAEYDWTAVGPRVIEVYQHAIGGTGAPSGLLRLRS